MGNDDDMRISNWTKATGRMTPNDFAILRDQVKHDESFRATPYDDATGKELRPGDVLTGQITIGWGTNLSAGISRLFASRALDDRLETAVAELTLGFPFVLDLDPVRQIVLGNMAYNLGMPRLAKFVKMWAALRVNNFETAALEMMDSKWSRDVGPRATRLAEMMRRGELL